MCHSDFSRISGILTHAALRQKAQKSGTAKLHCTIERQFSCQASAATLL